MGQNCQKKGFLTFNQREMKFKIDENLPSELADMLHAAGHDGSTVYVQQLAGQPDSMVSKVCKREGRIIVTLDVGFADIRQYPPKEYAGIIVLRLRNQDKMAVIQVFGQLIPLLSAEITNKLWIVDEKKVRVRD